MDEGERLRGLERAREAAVGGLQERIDVQLAENGVPGADDAWPEEEELGYEEVYGWDSEEGEPGYEDGLDFE